MIICVECRCGGEIELGGGARTATLLTKEGNKVLGVSVGRVFIATVAKFGGNFGTTK